MAAEIGLLSMTQIQKLSQSQHQYQHYHHHQDQPNPNSPSGPWMWNPREQQEDDDSWEVRAFAEDTRNIMGTTWPPRSYTCTFCRREFRSAQALGGHMNVHRRDRARLHQAQPASVLLNPNSSPTSSFIIPAQDLVANGGLRLFYHLPSPNGPFTAATPAALNGACGESISPSTLLSISSYPPNNLMSASFEFPAASPVGINSSYCNSTKLEEAATSSSSADNPHQEVDLELRLGRRPAPT